MENIDNSFHEYINSPDIAQKYDEFFAENPLFKYDITFIDENVRDGEAVLDLGTGTGRILPALIKKKCEVTAVDLSEHMIKCARERLSSFPDHSVKLIQADMTKLPFDISLKFDSVLLMFSTLGMLQGNDSRIQFLKYLKGYLKPQGKIIMHLHNYHYKRHSIISRGKRLVDRFAGIEDYEYGDHIVRNYRGLFDLRLHSFTLKEINELVKNAGYFIDQLIPLNDYRDGICSSPDIDRRANGFIVSIKSLDNS